MTKGDLVARLRWLAANDRPTLVEVLATIEPDALYAALIRAERPDRTSTPGPASRGG